MLLVSPKAETPTVVPSAAVSSGSILELLTLYLSELGVDELQLWVSAKSAEVLRQLALLSLLTIEPGISSGT